MKLPIDDPELTMKYIAEKWDDWHTRLRRVEGKVDDLCETLKNINHKLDEIYIGMMGTPDGEKRGILFRLGVVENWKKVISWAIGVLYVAVVSACVAMVIKTKNGG